MRNLFCRAVTVSLLILLSHTSALAQTPATSRQPDKQWAFTPPARVTPPTAAHKVWARGSINSFVLAKLEQAGLRPSPQADKLTLIRRVTFDLTGLPPTPDEITSFLRDMSANAYETVVDRLLASPRYGERWARHWLDLVRYADSEGFKSDEMRPDAWRYRDYVIRAFNTDKPYDRFIKEQLAGDEIAPDDADARIATGFCRHWADESNARDIMLRRQEILNDITDTTGAAMLGLTMGCARCHDHKYDPISQKDYYRLQAFFAGVRPREDLSALPAEQQAEWERKQKAWEAKTADARAALAALERPYREKIEAAKRYKFPDEVKEAAVTPPDRRTPLQAILYSKTLPQIVANDADIDGAMKSAPAEDRVRRAELKASIAAFDNLKPPPLPHALGISDIGADSPPTYRLQGGVYTKPAEKVEPGFLSIVTARDPDIQPTRGSSGRRTALANWIASPSNPLTARVLVNRLWQHHFGRGIVSSPGDFGAAGERPTHPELLDWLASEFVRRGWSIKQMQRLIVTSATYRQSANSEATAARVDPENTLLWRFRRQRLEGESLRDAMLACSGTLSSQMGGPGIMAELPAAVTARGYWKNTTDPDQQGRRSIYVFVKRNMRYPLFEAFDFPDTHEPCARRQTTTTAPQALLLLNDDTCVNLAHAFADRVEKEAGTDSEKRIDRAYTLAYGRPPTYDERGAALAFLTRQTRLAARHGAAGTVSSPAPRAPAAKSTTGKLPTPASEPPAEAAFTDFCHALFNSNEFCYVE